VTGLDWVILVFVLAMGLWGYQQGLLVGALSLTGFLLGAFVGSRLGPALLEGGSESPYAPVTALAGALLIGGILAVSLEGLALALRERVVRWDVAAIADGVGGAALLAALGLGLAWLFGTVALNAPGAKDLRQAVQRSAILRALNDAFPPSGDLLNFLNRIDPGPSITGPGPGVGPPDAQIAGDPEVRGDEDSVVRVTGTACGLGVEGSGWVAAPGVVVTNAHVIAGEDDTEISFSGEGETHDATAVHYDPRNDLAILRVGGIDAPALSLVPEPRKGTPGAVLGYPENGPFTITPARLGATDQVVAEDSYGRGPITRELTAVRAEVRSGNSGGPVVDGDGRVMTTIFAATTDSAKPSGFGVPNAIVREALADTSGEADTGPCTR
jgi:S1-C subfamily serine protease